VKIVYPKDAVVDFSTTVDDHFIEQLRLRDSERFIALDSREIFCCEVSSARPSSMSATWLAGETFSAT
jgi:hypothetical protein